MSGTDNGSLKPRHYLRDDLVWVRPLAQRSQTARPALFLDRDGVIIEERHYLSRAEDVSIISGAAEVINSHRKAGYTVVVVTNQSGIGRGYFDWTTYAAIEDHILTSLAALGAQVDLVLACGHAPLGGRAPYNCDHPWRKPAPGMIIAACDYLNLDLHRSYLIGDKASDICAARAAQLPRAVHVATGHGTNERAEALRASNPNFIVEAVDSIADCLIN